MWVLSVSTYGPEISHTLRLRWIYYSNESLAVVEAAGWTALIRQQLISSQAACVRACVRHGGAGTWTHARARSHVRENKVTVFKTLLLRLAETSDQTRKHAENSAGSYLLLQRARGARRVWAGEDKDISNARLRPAKQTKLTYSLIAFNKDNTSPEYRWDPERRRRLRAPPQTGWHTNKAGELIFNSKLWIPNRLSQRLPLPQQTFF